MCTKDTVADLKPWRLPGVELFPLGLLTLESVMPDSPERPQCLRSARFGLWPGWPLAGSPVPTRESDLTTLRLG